MKKEAPAKRRHTGKGYHRLQRGKGYCQYWGARGKKKRVHEKNHAILRQGV